MGLISVAASSMRGALQDVWRDYFYVDAIPEDVLVMRAHRRTGRRSKSNSEENVISNGSIISINDGQCAIITMNGLIQDICTESGEFIYNSSTEPSMLCEGFIKDTLSSIGRRFKFGGDLAQEYRVYYINTKEILGAQFGTSSPIPFRVVDERAGIDVDIRLKMAGSFTFRVTNPVCLYQKVTGNVVDEYKTDEISKQLRQEFLSAIVSALSVLSARGLRYSEIMLHTNEVEQEIINILTENWEEDRGIRLCNIAFVSIVPLDEDVTMIQQLQRAATFTDARLANANMMSAQMDAMRSAASNEAGAMTGFMGINMAMGGMSPYQQPMYGYQQPMYQPQPTQPNYYQPQPQHSYHQSQPQQNHNGYRQAGQQQRHPMQSPNRQPYQPQQERGTAPIMGSNTWLCTCGHKVPNEYSFCPKCGSDRTV